MKAPTPETARRLRALLDRHSRGEKHIGYHILPERLNALLAGSGLENRYTFHEPPNGWRSSASHDRLSSGRSVLDIGCNIGWFLVGCAGRRCALARGRLGRQGLVRRVSGSRPIQRTGGARTASSCTPATTASTTGPIGQAGGAAAPHFDVALLLNVLHHLGDDYGDPGLGIAASATRACCDQLNGLSTPGTTTLLFQLGFNWKGNRQVWACSSTWYQGRDDRLRDRQGTQGRLDDRRDRYRPAQ
jgi:hypothetical protein